MKLLELSAKVAVLFSWLVTCRLWDLLMSANEYSYVDSSEWGGCASVVVGSAGASGWCDYDAVSAKGDLGSVGGAGA